MNSYDGIQFLDSARIAADKARGIEFSEDGRTLLEYNRELTDRRYTVPTGVTAIGAHAFFGCSNLRSVKIPDGVRSIGDRAFACCDELDDVTIPDGVTSIGADAFSCCCKMNCITIPGSVTSIGDGAFMGAKKVTVTPGNRIFAADSRGAVFDLARGILLFFPPDVSGEYTIPDGVKRIGKDAFFLSHLTDVEIPDSVTGIGIHAFGGCHNLMSVSLPDGVTAISASVFSNCDELMSVDLPDGLTSIGEEAFSDCSQLLRIDIPDSVTSIGDYAFSCTGLMMVHFPDNLISIGRMAFFRCAELTDVEIPEGVMNIGAGAFAGVPEVTIASENRFFFTDSHGAIFDRTERALLYFPPDFSGTYTIPNGVTSIGDMAFYECSRLTGVDIPDSVTSIGMYAFEGCAELDDVTIPGTVTDIGSNAFKGCPCEVSVKFDFPDYD